MRLLISGFLALVTASTASADQGAKIELDTTANPDKRSPRSVFLANGTAPEIVIEKKPNEECRFEFKREELKPDPSGLESFVAMLGKRFAPASAAQPAACDDLPELPAGTTPAAAAWAARESSLASHAIDFEERVENLRKDYQARVAQANELITCLTSAGGSSAHCVSKEAFEKERKTFIQATESLLGLGTTPFAAVEAEVTQTQTALDTAIKDPALQQLSVFKEWVAAAYARLACSAARVEGSKQVLTSLQASRDLLTRVVAALNAHRHTDLRQTILLPRDEQAKLTGTVSCVNFFTRTAVFDHPVPVTITYKAVPRTTFTVGVLGSALEKRKFGIEAARTAEAPGFRNVFAIQDEAEAQLVPFSFLNIHLVRWGNLRAPQAFGLALGVGVNGGTGKTELEYFVGPSFQFDRLALHVGVHIGRWVELGNGFDPGGPVPEKVTVVPVDRRYTGRLSFGLSYRVALP